MKKLITLFLAFTLFSCNDGDFDVPAFQFTNTVNSCGECTVHVANSSKTEVLVLSLNDKHINKVEGTATYPISTSLVVTYRLFDAAISTKYFCQSIPPFSPNVIKELEAKEGTVNIITSAITKDAIITGYKYKISISNFLLLDNDSRIFFETFDIGTFTKTL